MKYYNARKTALLKAHPKMTDAAAGKKAADAAAKYAARQHRYRAMTIARTELATAYNQGAYQGTLNAQQRGYIGDCKKVWVTADDERVCPICGGIDGETVNMNAAFSTGSLMPPAHPNCRCGVAFEEIDQTAPATAPSPATSPAPTANAPAQVNSLTTPPQSGTMGNGSGATPTFTEAKSLKEAEEYARTVLGIPTAMYKGLDVKVANECNKCLLDYFTRFPELKPNFNFIGESHERNTFLKPFVEQHFNDLYTARFPSMDPADIKQLVKASTDKQMRRLQVKSGNVASSFTPSIDDYKVAQGISINRGIGKKAETFIKEMEDSVKSKWSPVGCGTIRSVLDHEIGHQLDNLLGIRNIPEIQALYTSRTTKELTEQLSTYAWKNSNPNKFAEMIAEAWAEYNNNPTPRAIAKKVGETIETEYLKRFGTI